jgi:hypothetical protein
MQGPVNRSYTASVCLITSDYIGDSLNLVKTCISKVHFALQDADSPRRDHRREFPLVASGAGHTSYATCIFNANGQEVPLALSWNAQISIHIRFLRCATFFTPVVLQALDDHRQNMCRNKKNRLGLDGTSWKSPKTLICHTKLQWNGSIREC